MPSNLYENPILEIIMINTTAKIMELDFFMINNDFVFFNKNGIKRVQKMANKNGSEIKIAAILIGSKIGTSDIPTKNTTGITKNGNIFGSILFIEKIPREIIGRIKSAK